MSIDNDDTFAKEVIEQTSRIIAKQTADIKRELRAERSARQALEKKVNDLTENCANIDKKVNDLTENCAKIDNRLQAALGLEKKVNELTEQCTYLQNRLQVAEAERPDHHKCIESTRRAFTSALIQLQVDTTEPMAATADMQGVPLEIQVTEPEPGCSATQNLLATKLRHGTSSVQQSQFTTAQFTEQPQPEQKTDKRSLEQPIEGKGKKKKKTATPTRGSVVTTLDEVPTPLRDSIAPFMRTGMNDYLNDVQRAFLIYRIHTSKKTGEKINEAYINALIAEGVLNNLWEEGWTPSDKYTFPRYLKDRIHNEKKKMSRRESLDTSNDLVNNYIEMYMNQDTKEDANSGGLPE